MRTCTFGPYSDCMIASISCGVTWILSAASARRANIGQTISLAYCSGVTSRSFSHGFEKEQLGAQAELVRRATDLVIHIGLSNRDALALHACRIQILVQQIVEHDGAESAKAFLSSLSRVIV